MLKQIHSLFELVLFIYFSLFIIPPKDYIVLLSLCCVLCIREGEDFYLIYNIFTFRTFSIRSCVYTLINFIFHFLYMNNVHLHSLYNLFYLTYLLRYISTIIVHLYIVYIPTYIYF